MNQMGDCIRQCRRAKDKSQYALAMDVGCSESTIRNLESGRTSLLRILKPYREKLFDIFPQLRTCVKVDGNRQG